MFCPYCGKTLPDDSMFCDACGNSLAAVQDAPQPQQPQFQQPAQQIQYQPQQPKKNRTGLIAAIAGVAVVGVLAVVLIPRLGAGKDDVVTDEPPAKEEREDKPTGSSSRPRDEEKNDDDKPAFEATPVERPQAEPEPEPEPEPVAWLDERDVRITRQGAFAYKTAINDGETDIGEISLSRNDERSPRARKRIRSHRDPGNYESGCRSFVPSDIRSSQEISVYPWFSPSNLF